jgi:multidrug efflux pump subunit AcrB
MTFKFPPRNPHELGLFRFFITQNVFINILYVGVFVIGLILWFVIMNREAFGNFDFDIVTIQTTYQGATAEEVEQLVTMPIENGMKTVEGIEEMTSISIEGLSVVTLQLDPDVDDTQKTVRDIEREVEAVRTLDLPEDGDEPRVTEITAAFPVITVGLSGDIPEMDLRDIAEDLEDDILDIEGVSRVSKRGYKEKQIWVEADLRALRRTDLSLIDLVNSIRQANHTSPGGRLELGGKEILVRTMGKLETVEDVENVVVRSNDVGNLLFIKDVANVTERLERERQFSRLNGARSIELDVLKKDSGDTLEIDRAIKELINAYKKNSPEINFGYANEISFYINRRLKVLLTNGAVGIILVLTIMFLFLKPISAFWSTSAIPFAFLGGLITMHTFGMTINLLSLFAFILVSGMLVDNGIVVAEHIERKREEGLPLFTAVSVGVSEMALPVFAAALTTIIAFLPLASMAGITGKFLRQMPLVLIACLVMDLLECLFILPGHLFHYDFKFRLPKSIQAVRTSAQRGLGWLTTHYQTLIVKTVHHPFVVMLAIIFFFSCLGGLAAWKSKFRLFPNIIDMFAINFELPVGATLDRTEDVVKGFEKIVATLPQEEIEAVIGRVGSQVTTQGRLDSGTNIGQVFVYLNKAKEDRIHGQVLIDQIRSDAEKWAQESGVVKFELEKIRGGPPTGRPIEVQLIGKDYDTILDFTEETKKFLESLDGTMGIEDDFDEGKDEFQLSINRTTVARVGLTPAQVATVIRAAFDGQEATEIKRVGETEDVSVRVKLTEADRENKATLRKLTITNPRGQQIPLISLVKIREDKGLLDILRREGDRTVTVTGDIDEEITTSRYVNQQLQKFLDDNIKNYSRMRYLFGGEKKNQDESMASILKAILVALGLIYLVLATLFRDYWEPFIIMSVVPFALIGITLSLLVVGKPITLLVLIGFAGLTGVVVNNSILMLETFNRLREQKNTTIDEAVIEGATHRLRPILLTTFSTFFGVMPLGLGLGGKEPFLQDMAFSFGWGLLVCSLVTIVWVPAFFSGSIWVENFLIGIFKGGKSEDGTKK